MRYWRGPAEAPPDPAGDAASRGSWERRMKGAQKPKKLGKKEPQKSLKEKRADKRAAAKPGHGLGT